MTTTTVDLVDLFTRAAGYRQIDLGDVAPADAYQQAARELRFPGHLAAGDPGPPNEYATHNLVLRALGTYAKRARLATPSQALCEAERCARLRIPGFSSCHWHGASATPDDEILAIMTAELEDVDTSGGARCAGSTRAGRPCRSWPAAGSDYCAAHAEDGV